MKHFYSNKNAHNTLFTSGWKSVVGGVFAFLSILLFKRTIIVIIKGGCEKYAVKLSYSNYCFNALRKLWVFFLAISVFLFVSTSAWGQTTTLTSTLAAATFCVNGGSSCTPTLPSWVTNNGMGTANVTPSGTIDPTPLVDFSGISTTKCYFWKAPSSKGFNILSVANATKLHIYGNGSSSGRTVTVTVKKCSDASTLGTKTMSFPNANTNIIDHNVDISTLPDYSATECYNIYVTTNGDIYVWGIALEAPSCAAGTPTNLTVTKNCDGTATLSSTSTAATDDTWYWQTSATETDKTKTSPYSVNTAATYYLRAFNTAGNCWGTAASTTVSTADLPTTLSITSANAIQIPNTLALIGSPTGGAWTVTNGTGSANLTGSTLTPLTDGDVTVTYTLNGCSTQQVVTISSSTVCNVSCPAVTGLGYELGSSTSAEKLFTVAWVNLPAGGQITLTPSADYQISINGGSTWGNAGTAVTYTASPVTGGNSGANIKIRLVTGKAINTYPGTVTIAATADNTCTSTVNVSGSVVPVPVCSIPPIAAITDMAYTEGAGPSGAKPLSVVWANLPAGGVITIAPPVGFEIFDPTSSTWKSTNFTYTASPLTGGTLNTQVRMAAGLSAGAKSGSLQITTANATCNTTVSLGGTVREPAVGCSGGTPITTNWPLISTNDAVQGTNTDISGDVIGVGNQITSQAWNNGTGKRIKATSWPSVATDGYHVNIPMQLATDASAVIDKLTIDASVSGSSSGVVVKYKLQASVNGGAFVDFGNENTITYNNASTLTFTAATPLQVPTGASVLFRLFVYSTATSGSKNIDFKNIVVSGETCTSTPKGSLTVTPSTLSGFTNDGCNRNVEQFIVNGSDLTNNGTINLSATSAYEYSVDNFATAPVTSFAYTGTSFTKTVYVRLKNGLTDGNYNNQTITLSGGGYVGVAPVVLLSGTVASAVKLSYTPTPLNLSYTVGSGPSAVQSTTLSYSDVPAGTSIALSLPGTNYVYSLTSATGPWDNLASFTPTIATGTQTIYYQLKSGLAAGTYNNEFTASFGCYSAKLPLNGTVVGVGCNLWVDKIALTNLDRTAGSSNLTYNTQSIVVSWSGLVVGNNIRFSKITSDYEISWDGGIIWVNGDNRDYPVPTTSGSVIVLVRKRSTSNGNNTTTEMTITSVAGCPNNVKVSLNGRTGCTTTLDVSTISGLDYFEGSGPSAIVPVTVTWTYLRYDLELNSIGSDFEYSLNGTDWNTSTDDIPFGIPTSQLAAGSKTFYVRLKAGLSAGTKPKTINVQPVSSSDECRSTLALSGIVSIKPKITTDKMDNVCCQGESIVLTTKDFTGASTYTWQWNDNGVWKPLTGTGASITVTPPYGYVLYRATSNNGLSATITVRTVVCCSAVGNSTVVLTEDFGTISGTARKCVTNFQAVSYSCDGVGTTNNVNDGHYTIVNNSRVAATYFRDMPDHTTGDVDGAMMVINGSDPGQVAFRRVFTGLCPNTLYNFSAWFANIHNSTTTNLPNLDFVLKSADGSVILDRVNTGDIPFGGAWVQGGISFNSGENSSVMLEIVSNKPSGGGNDYAIDDISFITCSPDTYLNIYVNQYPVIDYTICASNEPIVLKAETDFNIDDFYPAVKYAFLYKKTTDTYWTVLAPAQTSGSHQFNGNTLPLGTFEFMAVVGNNLTVVNEVVEYYKTGGLDAISIGTCDRYSVSKKSVIRKPDLPTGTIVYPEYVCTTGSAVTPGNTVSITTGATYTVAPAGLTINATTGTITPSSSTPGTYTITYSVPTTAPCNTFTLKDTIIVYKTETPAVSIVADKTTICHGAGTTVTFTATASGGGAAPTYQWYLNGSPAGTNSPTYSNNALNNGDQVSVVYTNTDVNPCKGPAATSNTVTITVENPGVTITTTPTNTTKLTCLQESIVLNANTSVVPAGTTLTYSWSPGGETTQTKTVTAAGTYTVTVSTPNGCTATASIDITEEHTEANLVTHNPAAVCAPGTVDLTLPAVTAGSQLPSDAVLTYWTDANEGTVLTNPSAVSASGTYYISYNTSRTVCNKRPQAVQVTIHPKPDTSPIYHD